jgi:hypothetical protein
MAQRGVELACNLRLWQITFDPLELGSKVIYQRGKTFFFSSEI